MDLYSLRLWLPFIVLFASTGVVGQRVWLYAYVSTDQGGDAMLPHFINHYHQLGLTYRRMLILVHHDPQLAPKESFTNIAAICHAYNLECKVWEGKYDVDEQYKQHLQMLQDFVYDPYDWILVAEADEFQDWEGPVKHAVEHANRKRAYYITGPYVNRFGKGFRASSVPKISEDGTRDLFDAFPLRCPPPSVIYEYVDPESPPASQPFGGPLGHHPGSKVVAFRNSMRVSRLRDKVISPDEAKTYLGDCRDTELSNCPRASLQGPPESLYHLTPYSTYASQYRYKDTPEKEDIHMNITLWHDVEWGGIQVPIHRFAWAKETLSKHKAWIKRYKGTCRLDELGSDCTPLLESWHQRATMYLSAISGHPMEVSEECDTGRLQGTETDTTYGGLAWEEFETSLKVVSKGDAYAPPTKVLVQVQSGVARFPEDLYKTSIRRVALCDYLTRILGKIVRTPGRNSKDHGWSGEKGGDINVMQVGQYVLERSVVSLDSESGMVEARLSMALPARGRNILGKVAANMIMDRLPEYVSTALKFSSQDNPALLRHIHVVEDAEALRNSLKKNKLVAFVADGSILPRKSGSSDKPLDDHSVVPFSSPDKYRVTLTTPNSGDIIGMGIPVGITLIVGGGFHGKSTLLEAIQMGIYNKIPGDGRELVVTDHSSVKIRAEDGRKVNAVDISPFLRELPGGKQTQCFSTEDASGSTSQAAFLQEAIEQKCSLLLLDEDSTASNLMMRDSRIQELIHRDFEPITPFSHQVVALKLSGVSTILVIGGSGEYFSVADHIIAIKNYHATDVTDAAKEIAFRHDKLSHETDISMDVTNHPDDQSVYPLANPRVMLKNQFSIKKPKIKVRSLHLVDMDDELLDLNGLEQIVEEGQTKALACAISVLAKRVNGPWAGKSFRESLEILEKDIDVHGLVKLSEDHMDGTLTRPRSHEIAAACNRLRKGNFTQWHQEP